MFGLFSAQGVVNDSPRPAHGRHARQARIGLALSPDAASCASGLGYREDKSVLFDLAAASLTDSPNLPPKFLTRESRRPPGDGLGEQLRAEIQGRETRARGLRKVSERWRSGPTRPASRSGPNWSVRAYDAKGKEHWKQRRPGHRLGRRFLRRRRNPRRRLWRRHDPLAALVDGEELLAFFVEPQSRKWVAWTPSRLLHGLGRRRGPDRLARQPRLDPGGRLLPRLAVPRRLQPARHRQARAEDDATRPRRSSSANAAASARRAKPVAAALPPVVTITSPGDGVAFLGRTGRRSPIRCVRPPGLPIDRLDVLADGEPIAASGFEKINSREAEGHITARLPRKDTVVSLIARSGDLTSAPAKVKLAYDGPSSSRTVEAKALRVARRRHWLSKP